MKGSTMTTNRIPAKTATTKLERAVLRWINARGEDYAGSGVAGALADLFYGGCSSGMVSDLIYTADCVRFYKRHQKEIDGLLAQMVSDTGLAPHELFKGNSHNMGWDAEDPLARDDTNQNILAWFGFEETARRLADRAGIEASK